MHQDHCINLRKTLKEIEHEMRLLKIWSDHPPQAEAFLSTQPFCIDTMTLPEWIQFVFIHKISELMTLGAELPSRCGIAPMIDEYFKSSNLNYKHLMGLFVEVDYLLGGLAVN